MQIQTIIDITIMPFKYLCENNYELVAQSNMPIKMQMLFLAHNFYVLVVHVPLKKRYSMELTDNIRNFTFTLSRLKQKYGDIYCNETIIDKKETLMPFKDNNTSVLGGKRSYDCTFLENGLAVLSSHYNLRRDTNE